MKWKYALVLIVSLGSAALVAAAQTQDPTYSSDRNTSFRVAPVARAGTLSAPVQDAQSGVTEDVSPAGVTVRRSAPGVQSYTRYTGHGLRPGVAQVNYVYEESGIAHETDQLIRQLGEAKSDSDRDKLKTKLGELLEKQFEQRQKRHESEIAELEAQIKKLKDLVAKRQENRREIIARRLEQIVRESQGLGW